MGSATGSQSYIAIKKQVPSTPTAIPANPVMQKVNFVSDSLSKSISTKASEHIRSDRATADLTRTGVEVGGGYEFEFQYENSLGDELLLGFLWCQQYTVNVAKNGSFYQPFFIERGHVDIGQYFRFLGMACNTMKLSFPDQGFVTGEYSFVGLSASLEQAVVAGATYTAPTANEVFSTVFSMPDISIDGVTLGSCLIKEMELEINNNVTPKTGLGVLGACETLAHKFVCTGSMTIYFQDEDMYARFAAGTAFELSWELQDTAGNKYEFLLPRVKINEDSIPVEGGDADIMENVGFTALYDATKTCVIQVTRTPHI